jgi:CRP-like cAMP-binding protein
MTLAVQTILRRNKLFRELPDATIEQLGKLAARRRYDDGAIVFAQGDPGDALFGVVTGRVRIGAVARGGKEMLLNIMEPGDTFGEIALLDGHARTATATATVDTELVVINRRQFLDFLEREPRLVTHLLTLLCERIRWTSGWAEDSVLLGVPARLARRLLSLATLHGHKTLGGTSLRISQEEVARFLGLSRQVVNQQLQEWKAQKWVALGRGRITVVDSAALHRVASENASSE